MQFSNQFDSKDKRMTCKLISSFKGEKVLIKSTRLRWLIKQGLVVSKIYGYIPYKQSRIFEEFMLKVSAERRKGDVDKDYAIILNSVSIMLKQILSVNILKYLKT
jgi:hypothetical protein